jgi:hypothetical protein
VNPSSTGERLEAPFELGLGEHEGLPVQEGTQHSHSRAARYPVQRDPQVRGCQEASLVRLVDHPFEFAGPDTGRHVDEDEDRVDHRDPFDDTDVLSQGGTTVAADTGPDPGGPCWHGHVDRPGLGTAKPP